MSSSRPLEHLRLPDLAREPAASRTPAFVPTPHMEVLHGARPPSLSQDEAYAKGLAEGEQRGRDDARRALVPVQEQLVALGRSLLAARRCVLAQAEQDLIAVAMDLARAILSAEIRMPSDLVLRQAQRCIDAATAEQGVLRLHVAPADLELVRTHAPVLETQLAAASLSVTADPHMTPGSVVLEARERCYEGRPDRLFELASARLLAVETALDDALGGGDVARGAAGDAE
jgi:hypothetical protein